MDNQLARALGGLAVGALAFIGFVVIVSAHGSWFASQVTELRCPELSQSQYRPTREIDWTAPRRPRRDW
jgi:hypothetical protein